MNRTFEEFLVDKYAEDMASEITDVVNVDIDGFPEWLEQTGVSLLVEFAEEWANQEFRKPMNDAYDALREDISVLRAMQVLAGALGLKQEGDNE